MKYWSVDKFYEGQFFEVYVLTSNVSLNNHEPQQWFIIGIRVILNANKSNNFITNE